MSCRPAAIQWGCEHKSWRTSMVSSCNLVMLSEVCNQAMINEGIADIDLACALVIFRICKQVTALWWSVVFNKSNYRSKPSVYSLTRDNIITMNGFFILAQSPHTSHVLCIKSSLIIGLVYFSHTSFNELLYYQFVSTRHRFLQ
jgi:hypothetical protein